MLLGVKDVLKKLREAEAAIVKSASRGVEMASLATASHIKKEFRRSLTGKGFDNVTGRLRASIGHKVVFTMKGHIIGYVFAGTNYAVYVEFRWEGKYAYLWPGIKEMQKEILAILVRETKGIFK